MRLPYGFLNSVVFLFCYVDGKPRAIGTGFFVETVDNFDGAAIMSTYLITARHVVENASNKLGAEQIAVRANGTNNNVLEWKVPIRSFLQSMIDGSSDITILPFSIDHEVCDARPIQLWHYDSYYNLNVGEGTQTVTIGLFHRLVGENRNIPIVRTGYVAAVPNEPIKTFYGNTKMYIIESRSLGGLSGAPVISVTPGYANPRVTTRLGSDMGYALAGFDPQPSFNTEIKMNNSYTLMGLTHGHWDASLVLDEKGRSEVTRDDIDFINEGLSLVTPIKRFFDLRKEAHVGDELAQRAEDFWRKARDKS